MTFLTAKKKKNRGNFLSRFPKINFSCFNDFFSAYYCINQHFCVNTLKSLFFLPLVKKSAYSIKSSFSKNMAGSLTSSLNDYLVGCKRGPWIRCCVFLYKWKKYIIKWHPHNFSLWRLISKFRSMLDISQVLHTTNYTTKRFTLKKQQISLINSAFLGSRANSLSFVLIFTTK